MSYYCFFDQLPTELLHLIFDYFSGLEILFTFYNINDYINGTLESYSSYQVDLRSISKSDFRRICRHIRPEQVISLILSDGYDTPGQSELFFSRFQIEQFIRLRSLTLIEIEYNSLKSIFNNLSQLKQLRSFSFNANSVRYTYQSKHLISNDEIEQMNDILRNTYAEIFPRLNFLYLNGNWILDSIPLSNLLHLQLEYCPIDKLETITTLVPKLRSLDICLNFDRINFKLALLPSLLIRLNLKIQDFLVSMNYIGYLLSNCLYLKYLELQVKGLEDLVDGQRWQILTNSLITFNFKLHIRSYFNEEYFNTFRTSYWLEEKQWFVAYENQYLFTVPYFSRKQVQSNYQPPVLTTAPDKSFFYTNVTKLIVNDSQISNKYITHINTIDFESTILQEEFFNTIDFHYIKYLSVLSLDDLIQFSLFEHIIPHVCQLSVENEITVKNIQQLINKSYRQIHKLIIKISPEKEDYISEQLFQLFPHTKYLIYKSNIQSIRRMVRFIDGFTHLLNASFTSFCLPSTYDGSSYLNPDLMILKTNRIIYGITMCRIYVIFTNSSVFSVNWWIEE